MDNLEQWQIDLQNSIRTIERLEKHIPVENRGNMEKILANMRLSITPHTLKLIDFANPKDPLLLMSIPDERELNFSPEELADPIGDEAKSPVPFLTHRYPDRVLVYPTFSCAGYCRFCFRRHKTGRATPSPTATDIERIFKYLTEHPEIEEVILSGGDPLTLTDAQIEEWLTRLRETPTIRRIRIHTRVPVNLPSRITDSLVNILVRHMDNRHPIYIVTHFNHPKEIAEENVQAIEKLVNKGIVVRNQSVLLKGVNDSAEILKELFKQLTDIRVIPYYLHQLDRARGTSHFRVPIEQGIGLMRKLQGKVTGIALPRYMLDRPGGMGKIPIVHNYLIENDNGWIAESPHGEKIKYM